MRFTCDLLAGACVTSVLNARIKVADSYSEEGMGLSHRSVDDPALRLYRLQEGSHILCRPRTRPFGNSLRAQTKAIFRDTGQMRSIRR